MQSPLSWQSRIGLWCGGRVTLGAVGGWCVVLDCCMLQSVLVPSLLCFARFYQSSFFINLGDSSCNTVDIAYNNYSSDDTRWQGYIAINIIPFNLLAVLT